MTDSPASPAGWYPDPGGQHAHRYWDGAAWTDQVAGQVGGQGETPSPPASAVANTPASTAANAKVQRQVQRQARITGVGPGGGTIFTEPVLVVNQKAKLIEVHNEYAIFDQVGHQIGAVRQVGQSAAKVVLRMLTSLDQFMTHRLEVVDMAGQVQLAVTRPAKLVKSRVVIADGQGREIGVVRQENAIGKIRFAFEVGGQRVGAILAENWRAWNFSIRDAADIECARITKTWEGLAKTLFTTADNYVLQIHRPLEEPLRSMVVASALCVDTALKQDSRGFG